jgi:radical SAM-linked protein
VLARGGRRLAAVIEHVAHAGVGLEAWQDWFSVARWEAALAVVGTALDEELARPVGDLEQAPWAHIDTGLTAEFRARELAKARAVASTPDCRDAGCDICGLEGACEVAADATAYRLPHGEDAPPTPEAPEPPDQRLPVCQAIVTFAKEEPARFLAHLDISRALQRALRRAGLPVAYSQGYHQRPRMTIARPLPLGVTGDGELCAIDLYARCSSLDFARALNSQLPRGLALREVQVLERVTKSPFARVSVAEYAVELESVPADALSEAVAALLAAPSLEVRRDAKRGERAVDIRSGILAAGAVEEPPGLHLELACTDEYMVKPDEVVAALNRRLAERGAPPLTVVRVHRERLTGDSRRAP